MFKRILSEATVYQDAEAAFPMFQPTLQLLVLHGQPYLRLLVL